MELLENNIEKHINIMKDGLNLDILEIQILLHNENCYKHNSFF